MTSLLPQASPTTTDTWIAATWNDYLQTIERSPYDEGRAYYDQGRMRIEMAPLGPFHARENSIVSNVVSLFATFNGIRIVELTNGTIRQSGNRDGQPDIAFYVGEDFAIPPQNNQPLDVEIYGAPHLVIEISATSSSDDLGAKRLLYERFDVAEYWVVDLTAFSVIAFEIAERRSGEIRTSRVLPGLRLDLVEVALKRSQSEDDGAINRWLISTFQNLIREEDAQK